MRDMEEKDNIFVNGIADSIRDAVLMAAKVTASDERDEIAMRAAHLFAQTIICMTMKLVMDVDDGSDSRDILESIITDLRSSLEINLAVSGKVTKQ